MNIFTLRKRINLTVGAVILLTGSIASSYPDDIAQLDFSPVSLAFYPTGAYAEFTLTVTGPEGYYFREEFDGAVIPLFQLSKSDSLTDGQYYYELVGLPELRRRPRFDDMTFTNTEDGNNALSGTFRVINGVILGSAAENDPDNDNDSDEANLQKDQLFNDDLIVSGSACVGFDCVNNESFGFDTIRLKENNLRLKFQDTSTGSFPSNDWQLTANDSTNGGANKFSIDDIDGGRTPFTIVAGAPSNSLFVNSNGRIGIGTSTPAVEAHIADGDSPALRLEQNGSSGFTPQTWDIAGNETNFFIRDVTNGSKLPFKIKPGADNNSLFINSNSDIGLGTASPTSSLHIRRANATLKVEDTDTSISEKVLFTLSNAGSGKSRMAFSNSGITWTLDAESGASGFFNISKVGTGVNEFRVQDNGDGFFNGDVYSKGVKLTSSRQLKTHIEPVDVADILDKLAKLDVSSWQFTHDEEENRHIGPMAEDFQNLFGGTDERHIDMTDANGVLFAAVKGLYQMVNDKHLEIEKLERQNRLLATENTTQKQINDNLESRITALEKLLLNSPKAGLASQ